MRVIAEGHAGDGEAAQEELSPQPNGIHRAIVLFSGRWVPGVVADGAATEVTGWWKGVMTGEARGVKK